MYGVEAATAAWAIAFDTDDFETFLVESEDTVKTYSQEYSKANLIGKSMNSETLLANNARITELGGASVYINTWKRVRHIPASLSGWELATHQLAGTEAFGTEDVDSAAWAIAFTSLNYIYIKFKVESGDGSYQVEYFKNDLLGDIDADIFLSDTAEISSKGGANVYIS